MAAKTTTDQRVVEHILAAENALGGNHEVASAHALLALAYIGRDLLGELEKSRCDHGHPELFAQCRLCVMLSTP